MSKTAPNHDVLITIFATFPVPTLLRCEQVCRQWCDISRKETAAIWKPKLVTAFPDGCLPVLWGRENWRDVVCLWWAWGRPWTPEVRFVRPEDPFQFGITKAVPANVEEEGMDVITDSVSVLGIQSGKILTAEDLSRDVSQHGQIHLVRHANLPVSCPFEPYRPGDALTHCRDITLRHAPRRMEVPPPQNAYTLLRASDTTSSSPRELVATRDPIAFNETLIALFAVPSATLHPLDPYTIKLCRLADMKTIATTTVDLSFSSTSNGAFIMTRFNLIIRDSALSPSGIVFNLKIFSLRDLSYLYKVTLPFQLELDILPLNTGNIGLKSRRTRYETFEAFTEPYENVFGASPRILDALSRELISIETWEKKRGKDTVVRSRCWEVGADGKRTGRPGLDRFVWWRRSTPELEEGMKKAADMERMEGSVWVYDRWKGFCRI
ncbi:hypothetical protein HDV00_004672 [Rhizophlyctis rosea]|nr:hypothetical protein HDV00_004672 [Rhizophlyctis rosea]